MSSFGEQETSVTLTKTSRRKRVLSKLEKEKRVSSCMRCMGGYGKTTKWKCQCQWVWESQPRESQKHEDLGILWLLPGTVFNLTPLPHSRPFRLQCQLSLSLELTQQGWLGTELRKCSNRHAGATCWQSDSFVLEGPPLRLCSKRRQWGGSLVTVTDSRTQILERDEILVGLVDHWTSGR